MAEANAAPSRPAAHGPCASPFPFVVALALALALLASPVAAQDADHSEGARPGYAAVRGVVMDVLTGVRLEGARIQVEGIRGGTLTDPAGRFELGAVPLGQQTLLVDHYGFQGLGVTLAVASDMPDPLRIELTPLPVMLEGVEVVTERLAEMKSRLQSRRRATATSTRAFDLEWLTRSASSDMLEFLRLESSVHMTPCGRGFVSDLCVLRRGRWEQPRVYIDEVPAVGGLQQLATYRPDDLYLVEVYARGLQIRAYTHNFMERMARQPVALIPVALR